MTIFEIHTVQKVFIAIIVLIYTIGKKNLKPTTEVQILISLQ